MQIGQNEPKICISVDFCMCCADCNRKYDFAHKYIQKTKKCALFCPFRKFVVYKPGPRPGPYRGPTGAYRGLPGPTGALPGPYRGPTGHYRGPTEN